MKLAEALQTRGDLQKKLAELELRLSNNATVQEGELPAEDPVQLLKQVDQHILYLEDLVSKINLLNAKIQKNGKTMTQLLAKRDAMKRQLSIYRDFLYSASQLSNRARGSEIKIRSTIPVAEIQKEVDKKAADLRKLELEIQEINWLTEMEV